MAETISGNQEHTSADELAERARDIVARGFGEMVAQMVNRIEALRPDRRSSTDVMEIARAAQEGRVEALIVNLDETIYGRLDVGIGAVVPGDQEDAATYDILDELAGLTIRMGGQILGAHADQLPADLKAGAVFRYAV